MDEERMCVSVGVCSESKDVTKINVFSWNLSPILFNFYNMYDQDHPRLETL